MDGVLVPPHVCEVQLIRKGVQIVDIVLHRDGVGIHQGDGGHVEVVGPRLDRGFEARHGVGDVALPHLDIQKFVRPLGPLVDGVVHGLAGGLLGGDEGIGIPGRGAAVEDGEFISAVVVLGDAGLPVVVRLHGDEGVGIPGGGGIRLAVTSGHAGRVRRFRFIRPRRSLGRLLGAPDQTGCRQAEAEKKGEKSCFHIA